MPRFTPRNDNGLTQKQQEVLEYIKQFYVENGICPSSRIVQQRFGFASQTAAMSHIDRLVRKGELSKCPHSGRIIVKDERIPWDDVKDLITDLQDWQKSVGPNEHTSMLLEEFFKKHPHLKNDH